MRIVIVGGPKTGKTTLAAQLAGVETPVFATDDLIGKLEWGEDSAEVASWFGRPGPWIIEGVTTVRALRKWLLGNTGAPCDVVYRLEIPHQPLTSQQQTLHRQIRTQFGQISAELRDRGVTIRS